MTKRVHPPRQIDAARSEHFVRWSEEWTDTTPEPDAVARAAEAPELVAARQTRSGNKICPYCGGSKYAESMTCKRCLSKRVDEVNHSGRKAIKLDDLQAIYWSSEKAEKDLIPLVLFKGPWSLGYAQGLWNLTQALKSAEVETYVGAARFVRENPDVTHAAGLHLCASDLKEGSSSLGDKLWRLGNRVSSCGTTIDAETADYLRFLANRARRFVCSLTPISRYSPWSTQAWRRQAIPKTPVEPMPEYWPYFRETSTVLEGADLLLAIDSIVPKTLPKQVREDVCQDLVLAVLEGEITADDLRDRYQDFIKGVFRRFPVKYGHLSLDAPPPWDKSGRTLAETLVAS